MNRVRIERRTAAAAWLACVLTFTVAGAMAQCGPGAAAASHPTTIVELYTSEGCDSCPPADRWLAQLPRDGSVIALAFHVDYWDALGWRDRFDDAAFTARQRDVQSASGARFIYTPQIIANGIDFPAWRNSAPDRRLAVAALPTVGAPAALTLTRSGTRVTASIPAAPGQSKLGGYWALVEDGHTSAVTAGENSGRTLRHDHVVRRYDKLPSWQAGTAHEWGWDLPPATSGHAARVVFVLTDADGGKPLAARQIDLGCGSAGG